MAAQKTRDGDDDGLIADINVTPLVDITLVLLIIFMVAAPMIANNPSIKVELPKAATGDDTAKSTLALTLQRAESGSPRLFANGAPTDEAHVRTMIPEALEKNGNLQAVIAADKGIAYGDVVHLVDLVKALGVHRFALNTDAAP